MKKSRWLPAVIAPVVVAGAVAAPVIANAASPDSSSSHPSAARVLASVSDSKSTAYSGKLTQSSDLGLPSLPSGATTSGSSLQSGAANVLDLLTSSHSVRVYVDGVKKARVQLLGQLSEQDAIVNGSDVWTWDSKTQKAVHYVLPASSPSSSSTPTTETPTEIAQKAIAAITPTTKVSKPKATTVAGRSAWKVTLTPKSEGTLVSKVSLSIDRSTGLPLAASISAKGQKTPAVSVSFSNISFSTPSSKLFSFTPPSGAKVTTKHVSAPKHASRGMHPDSVRQGTIKGSTPTGSASASTSKRPKLTGTGWSSVAELPSGALGSALRGTSSKHAEGTNLFNELTTKVSGGRAIQSSLVSVFITSDGRVFAGAVPVSVLQAAAG
jgi:outer membrane lipoprotein-sorting protein